MTVVRTLCWLSLTSLLACSSAQTEGSGTLSGVSGGNGTTTAGPRNRPRRRAVNAALADAAAKSIACMQGQTFAQITVHGVFLGRTGIFRADRVEGTTDSIAACVTKQFATAAVDPFIQDEYGVSHTFGPDGTTLSQVIHPHSLYALAADGGVQQDDAGFVSLTAPADGATPFNTVQPATSNPLLLSPEAIANVMQARANEVTACYRTGLQNDPSLTMTLRVRALIEPAGVVSRVSSTTVARSGRVETATDVAACVETVVSETSFPPRVGGSAQNVVLPFNFVPAGGSVTTPTATPSPPAPGTADTTAVFAALQGQARALRVCYEQALRSDPTLAGRIRVRMVIDGTGAVIHTSSDTTVTTGSNDVMQTVAQCAESVVRATPLPPSTGGNAALVLPLDFSPSPRGQ